MTTTRSREVLEQVAARSLDGRRGLLHGNGVDDVDYDQRQALSVVKRHGAAVDGEMVAAVGHMKWLTSGVLADVIGRGAQPRLEEERAARRHGFRYDRAEVLLAAAQGIDGHPRGLHVGDRASQVEHDDRAAARRDRMAIVTLG